MKVMNDVIRSVKIKLGPSVDKWAVVIHMYVWLTTGKRLHVRRTSHKTGIEDTFISELRLMFDDVQRQYYGLKKKKNRR